MASVIQTYLSPDEEFDNLYGDMNQNSRRMLWIRRLHLIFLIIVLVGGMTILAVGIWTHEAEYGNKHLSSLINANIYQVDSILMIIAGSAIIAITLLGFCGVAFQYKCLMGLHLGLLAFMAVMLFVAGILGYVLISELENKVKEKMENVIKENYGINIQDDGSNRKITQAWDSIQYSFKCCGAFGDENSTTSWALYKNSQWVTGQFSNNSLVPDSCCEGKNNLDACTGRVKGTGPPTQGPPITVPISSLNYTLYTTGCFDVLQIYLTYTGVVIGTSAIVVGLFMLVELVLSICMYRTMPEN